MSFTGSGQGGAGQRGNEARAAERRRRADENTHARDLQNQGDDGISEAPRRRGLADRIRSVFARGDSSPGLFDSNVPREDVWERERRERAEHERDAS